MSKRFWSWALAASILVCATELSFLTGHKLAKPPAVQQANVNALRDASVMVKTEHGSGSGTIFRDGHGEFLILTAAHVTHGASRIIVSQEVVILGEKLYTVNIEATMIESNTEYDLALLRPKSVKAFSQWVRHFANIYQGSSIPAVTTPVVHIGSMFGEAGERSITYGTIAGIARPNPSKDAHTLDQMTAAACPGSSGGGVFDARTGQLIGVLTQGYSDSFSFFVPARDIKIFLEKTLH